MGNGHTIVTKPQKSYNPKNETSERNIGVMQSSEVSGMSEKH